MLYLLCIVFLHLSQGVFLQAGPLNVVFLILKLSWHLLTPGLDNPLCLPPGQEDGLLFAVLEQNRAMHTTAHTSVLPGLGRCMVLDPNDTGKPQLKWIHKVITSTWQSCLAKFCFPDSGSSSPIHKEKYFSYHLMSCPWPWNMRLAIQRRDGRIKPKVDVYFLLGLFWLDVSFCNWNRRNKPLFISIF